ncbi:MAG: RimK family protein [Gemmatimonadetes bacterium]|nr:RimK family protein [Gemmatimonadota bacterium]
MIPIVVVENPKRWPFELEGVEVVPARRYLVDPRYADLRRVAVYNVCRAYGYQTIGYYVSLLAAARGHRPLPSVATLQALGETALVRMASDELDDLIQSALAPLRSEEFRLSIYFGRNVTRRYDRLARALFNLFPAPFLRARFTWDERWKLASLRPIAGGDVPEQHLGFVLDQASQYFARPSRVRRPREYRYEMALLWSPDDPTKPSNERAIRRFMKAFEAQGIEPDIIAPDDEGRIAEYDALFIRETTAVNHHTYRIARRAAAEGLVVIDDPESIIRCGNKVYQAELFERHGIPCPRTLVVHEGNIDEVAATVGLPCVLKRPDGAFSRGVARVETEEGLRALVPDLFRESELLVAQSFVASTFDWRVGVLDRKPLFVCHYHMAAGHWQIVRGEGGETRYGKVETLGLADAPRDVVELGVKAASLIGDGLYGVDIKPVNGRLLVMEINDNPNVDGGFEDAVIKDALYDEVARWFRVRLDARGGGGSS